MIAAVLSIVLGACATSHGPLWTPASPRNGADQPVDPVYGTPIPGYPTINGGRS
jgi:hypothetical protein